MAFKAGVAEVEITPPVGVWLTGYAARTKPCIEVHDSLYAKALVLENSKGERAALLTLDLIALTTEQVQRLRRLVQDWTGIPPQNLLINCSHTHSAPAIGELAAPWMGTPDAAYLDVAIRKAATAVKMAAEDLLGEVQLKFGSSQCHIGINRRQRTPEGKIVLGQNPQGAVDPHVDVLVAEKPGEYSFKIILFSYACHPVVLGEDNYAVSADYVYRARMAVEDFFYHRAEALFLQGCAGNINPRERGNFEIAAKLGMELAASVVQAALNAQPVDDETIFGIAQTLKLPLLPPPSEKALRQWRKENLEKAKAAEREGRKGEARWRYCEAEWAAKVLAAMRNNSLPTHEPINAQVLRLGDVAFAALASETFSEIGLTVRKQSPLPRTVPVAYTNGCIGYLPTEAAYDEGGYEVQTAFKFYGRLLMLAPDSERMVTDWLLRQLHRCRS